MYLLHSKSDTCVRLFISFTCLSSPDTPEIEVERNFIHTGVGYEAQLTCTVHAEPQPHVIWYKDTTQLGTTEQHSQQVKFYIGCPVSYIFPIERVLIFPSFNLESWQ